MYNFYDNCIQWIERERERKKYLIYYILVTQK